LSSILTRLAGMVGRDLLWEHAGGSDRRLDDGTVPIAA
jgi:hypothetical protein